MDVGVVHPTLGAPDGSPADIVAAARHAEDLGFECGKSTGPGRALRLFLFRGPSADFSEADRALLTLLRPHLYQAYLDAERRRHPVPELTRRLDLVADGLTNTQIARRLGLSEGTVRTHLENIYRRLDVSSRTAAVTRAFPERDTHRV